MNDIAMFISYLLHVYLNLIDDVPYIDLVLITVLILHLRLEYEILRNNMYLT